jgi:hypothetical protein
MSSRLENFKARALATPEVRAEYDNLAEEFELLDEILKARAEAGQAIAASSLNPFNTAGSEHSAPQPTDEWRQHPAPLAPLTNSAAP